MKGVEIKSYIFYSGNYPNILENNIIITKAIDINKINNNVLCFYLFLSSIPKIFNFNYDSINFVYNYTKFQRKIFNIDFKAYYSEEFENIIIDDIKFLNNYKLLTILLTCGEYFRLIRCNFEFDKFDKDYWGLLIPQSFDFARDDTIMIAIGEKVNYPALTDGACKRLRL